MLSIAGSRYRPTTNRPNAARVSRKASHDAHFGPHRSPQAVGRSIRQAKIANHERRVAAGRRDAVGTGSHGTVGRRTSRDPGSNAAAQQYGAADDLPWRTRQGASAYGEVDLPTSRRRGAFDAVVLAE